MKAEEVPSARERMKALRYIVVGSEYYYVELEPNPSALLKKRGRLVRRGHSLASVGNHLVFLWLIY